MGVAIQSYGFQFVTPLYDSDDAAEAKRAVALKPSTTFARGTILGELTGTPGTFAPYVPSASWTGTSEVQTLTITATGGTYQLEVEGQLTGNIAYNASSATIQTAVNAALANIPGAGTVTVAGAGPYTFTYGGAYANSPQPLIDVLTAALTGGTATMARTTTGATGAPTDGSAKAQRILPYDCITDSSGNITLGGGGIVAGGGQYGITYLTVDVYSSGKFAKADLPNLDANAIAQLGRDLGNGELLVTGG